MAAPTDNELDIGINEKAVYTNEMKFISQQGFSILQGLILSALLAGSALVTSKLISDQKKVAISSKSKDAVEEMTDILFNLLQQQDNCSATFTLNGATGSLTGNANINTIYHANRSASGAGLPPQPVVTVNNAYFQNSISISSMRVEFPANVANLTPAVLVVNMRRNDAKDATLRTKDGFGGKDLTRRINLIIQRHEGTLAFKSCYAVKNSAEEASGNGNIALLREFCQGLSMPPLTVPGESLWPAYYWNNTTNTCELNNSVCPRDYFFVGIDSTGIAERGDGSVVASPGILGAARCRYARRAFNFSNLIETTGPINCNGRTMVKWEKVPGQNRVRITCN